MARGNLPAQTPGVPQDVFLAFDLLYRFLLQFDQDVRTLEGKILAADAAQASTTVLAEQVAFRQVLRPLQKIVIDARFAVNGNFAWQFIGSAAPSLAQLHTKKLQTSGITEAVTSAGTYPAADSISAAGFVEVQGVIQNGVTTSILSFNWAQAVSNASPTILYAGSRIRHSPIA